MRLDKSVLLYGNVGSSEREMRGGKKEKKRKEEKQEGNEQIYN
jgi:hypothetical protein